MTTVNKIQYLVSKKVFEVDRTSCWSEYLTEEGSYTRNLKKAKRFDSPPDMNYYPDSWLYSLITSEFMEPLQEPKNSKISLDNPQ